MTLFHSLSNTSRMTFEIIQSGKLVKCHFTMLEVLNVDLDVYLRLLILVSMETCNFYFPEPLRIAMEHFPMLLEIYKPGGAIGH